MERNDLLFTHRVVHLYKIASRLSSRYKYCDINIQLLNMDNIFLSYNITHQRLTPIYAVHINKFENGKL